MSSPIVGQIERALTEKASGFEVSGNTNVSCSVHIEEKYMVNCSYLPGATDKYNTNNTNKVMEGK